MVAVPNKDVYRAWLGDVPPDKVFWFPNGKTVKNLAELAVALEEIPEEIFLHHVTKDKNDFSKWIKEVIGDVTLANQLQKATTKEATARLVKKRIDWLKARV